MAESQKAPCENMFRAITNALLLTKACDHTEKVAFACTWHGCFAPNSLADLFKGKQQKNIDYALLQAIKTTHVEPEQGLFLICDIAIDLFHVHGHKDICFFHFATTFVPSAAVVAGQILESLWSSLNVISSLVQTASLTHREEIPTKKKYSELQMFFATDILMQLLWWEDIAQVTLNEWEDEIQSAEAMKGTRHRYQSQYQFWYSSQDVALISKANKRKADKVCQFSSAPQDQNPQIVMQLHQALTMMLAELKIQQQNAGVHNIQCGQQSIPLNNETKFDDIEENPDISVGLAVQADMQDHSVPEDHNPSTPTILSYKGLEMELGKQQAHNHITRIQDIVADILFLY
ncbi:hypothetical protein CVT25_006239 [Psilocybe cyanescens]|uniref:Uncharacterized protein n=1 Tax=Psilocybe cyanescens TaxID=93625 RepID=A0A409XQQ7_PSICY|nr:hypothetical protein CVT25_006239 [Psilocybe cyanescens]